MINHLNLVYYSGQRIEFYQGGREVIYQPAGIE